MGDDEIKNNENMNEQNNIVDETPQPINEGGQMEPATVPESSPSKSPKRKLSKKTKIIIVVATAILLVALAVAYWFFFINPSSNTDQDTDTAISAEDLVIDSKEDLETAKTILQQTVTKPTEDQEKIESQKE